MKSPDKKNANGSCYPGSQDNSITWLNNQFVGDKVQSLMEPMPKSNNGEGHYLFVHAACTQLLENIDTSHLDQKNCPYVVQLAWILTDKQGLYVSSGCEVIRQNVTIDQSASNLHGITNERVRFDGKEPYEELKKFVTGVEQCEYIIAHDLDTLLPVLQCELQRNDIHYSLLCKKTLSTKKAGMEFTHITDMNGIPKYPTHIELLSKLYFNLPNIKLEGLNNAISDVMIIYHCFMRMIERRPEILVKYSSNSYK